jgi:hypothetical protein
MKTYQRLAAREVFEAMASALFVGLVVLFVYLIVAMIAD